MIDRNHKDLSLRQQCKLLELHQSNLYHAASQESEEKLYLMRLLKECNLPAKHLQDYYWLMLLKLAWMLKCRVFDNIFIERLWRSVKYEEVYLKGYCSVKEAKEGLTHYFKFYNFEQHQHLKYKKPAEVYFNREFPVDYVNCVVNGLLVPQKIIYTINIVHRYSSNKLSFL